MVQNGGESGNTLGLLEAHGFESPRKSRDWYSGAAGQDSNQVVGSLDDILTEWFTGQPSMTLD